MSQELGAEWFAHIQRDVNDLVGDVLKLAFALASFARVRARIQINIISLNIFYQLIVDKSCFYDAIIGQSDESGLWMIVGIFIIVMMPGYCWVVR